MSARSARTNNSAGRHKRLRVLMLVENAGYPDDTRIAMESRCLRDAGHQVVVIAPTGNSKALHENVDDVIVYRYPQFWQLNGFIGYALEYAYSLAVAFAISLFVAVRHGFDVVHSRIPPDVYVLIGGFYKLFGKQFVADLQDSSPDLYAAQHDGAANSRVIALLRWWERQTCRKADCLITINETYRRMLAERAEIPIERCHVVRNAPDDDFLKPIEPLESLRADGRVIIGYMGIIGVQDRVDVLLQTLYCLKNELGRDDFLAVVVGSGPALEDVKNLSTRLKLDKQVRFTSFQVG
jgi:glycosyltransferase involved in cell wall biosynthesis